ncbi:hypothetical protein Slin15195_G029670 [Septoria linicola]|uniref:Glutamyl-tRNA synthetase n=1 Tax=Septoria linicola TaxID=215465 RepID=A0A9Q9AP46_9PEZI|nr:hypothetical protein Slin14017_G028700 [Septoria linicola]USW49648.1 hypothetical protein Slin15195_G029670 [Septoria linicola]
MGGNYAEARKEIYAAHDEDPTKISGPDGQEIAYETHYSQKMERYLEKRAPQASDVLRLAICGQHFRRWEVPRSQFPMTKIGYHSWRTHLKKRQAKLVGEILDKSGYAEDDVKRAIALIEKEGLKQGEPEVQVLEDVACLVFLDDQFDEFKEKHDEQKIITILKKTWVKMSEDGHNLALQIPMTDECKELVGKALGA